jgi:hypothetical protein
MDTADAEGMDGSEMNYLHVQAGKEYDENPFDTSAICDPPQQQPATALAATAANISWGSREDELRRKPSTSVTHTPVTRSRSSKGKGHASGLNDREQQEGHEQPVAKRLRFSPRSQHPDGSSDGRVGGGVAQVGQGHSSSTSVHAQGVQEHSASAVGAVKKGERIQRWRADWVDQRLPMGREIVYTDYISHVRSSDEKELYQRLFEEHQQTAVGGKVDWVSKSICALECV